MIITACLRDKPWKWFVCPYDPNHEDTPEEWLFSARSFVMALSHLLKDREGIVIEIDGVKRVVGHLNGEIFVSTDDWIIQDAVGSLVWIKTKDIEK